jgi:tellurite methyltransferase
MSRYRIDWLDAYREVAEHRKQLPESRLLDYIADIPAGPILDLGMGRGRHALFFAKMGRQVEGVDISEPPESVRDTIRKERLDLTYHVSDLRDFEIPKGRYALIIASRILQLFRRADIDAIAQRIQAGLKPKGLLYMFVFSVEDLEHIRKREAIEEVEENTYYHAGWDLHFHFFSRDEILGLFPDLRILSCMEGLVMERTGSNKRLNGVVEYVGQRKR